MQAVQMFVGKTELAPAELAVGSVCQKPKNSQDFSGVPVSGLLMGADPWEYKKETAFLG